MARNSRYQGATTVSECQVSFIEKNIRLFAVVTDRSLSRFTSAVLERYEIINNLFMGEFQ